MTYPIETVRPCPHVELDASCPRCHGDGFYTVVLEPDPLRAPGTDAYHQQPATPAPIYDPATGWLRGWITACLAGLVILFIGLILVWIGSSVSRETASPSPASSAAIVQRSGPAPVEGVTGVRLPVAAPLPAVGRVGGSVQIGKASWCAPKGKYCRGWGGHSILAASPNWDGEPYWARVCRQDRPKVCATVYVHSICACGTGKVIDLTVYVFRDLLGGRLHADGTLDVTVRGVRGPSLPATDTAP